MAMNDSSSFYRVRDAAKRAREVVLNRDSELVEVIGAFFMALGKAETYNPWSNPYIGFGFLWGLPIPFITFGIHMSAKKIEFVPSEIMTVCQDHPWQIFFLLHPLLFAVTFGAMGTIALERNRRILSMVDELDRLARTDGLTGLLNHRSFQESVRLESARAERERHGLALIMADIDYFKKFNDEYGHPAGDELLRKLADLIRSLQRPYDIACRYGGEEFALVLPMINEAEATATAERFRRSVEEQNFEIAKGVKVRVTMSFGVAAYHPGEPIPEWITRADRRLYHAKHSGRNRVVADDNSMALHDSPKR